MNILPLLDRPIAFQRSFIRLGRDCRIVSVAVDVLDKQNN